MNGWAYFAIGVGILMIGQWIYYLLNGKAPEIRTEPVELGFHLLAEFVTAFTLIIGGIVLLIGYRWGLALYLLGIGAMLYSVTNSAGYFAQRKQWPMVGIFSLLFVLGALAVLRVFALAG
jgi:hypothetical protein